MSSIATLPQILVDVDGSTLSADYVNFLGEIRVQQRLSLPTQCELTFYEPPDSLDIAALFTPGNRLRVAAKGYNAPLFTGEVTAVEYVYGPDHGREIRVRGYDHLHRLRKRQNVRAHVQVNAYELAQEFAADVGLTVQAAAPGPRWRRIYQHDQSDLALLTEITARSGLYLTQREEVLHLLTLAGDGAPLPLILGKSLLEARVEVNVDPACRTVSAIGWNPLRVESHSGRATQARMGRSIAAEAAPDQVGGDGQRTLVDENTPSDDHAAALAQAELDRRLAGEVIFWGVAEGDPQLRPGARIRVNGLAPSLAGRYVLTEVTHRIDGEQGFVSELSTRPPASPRRPKSAVSTVGIVTSAADPEGLGRVRVVLPAYGNVESDWMGVLSGGKGLVLLPDVDDRVLVLLTHEDPGQGVVLGGLYGMAGPPDSGVEDGAVRRYTLQTPGGQRIQLDDTNNVARFENSQGSYVELTPEKVHLHAAADLEIEAPGRAVLIRGDSIDFEQG